MRHVLIIEDEFLIALHIQGLLEDAGYESFDLAATESEAVRVARERRPSLIISDVRLGGGTGPAAVQTIKAECGAIPVVYITGNPEVCKICDPDAPLMIKPVDGYKLTKTVRDLAPSALAMNA